MAETFYINGQDAYARYGAFFGEDAIPALLTPAPNKPYIENSNRLSPGKESLVSNPQPQSREVQLTLYMEAPDRTEFYSRYEALCEVFAGGTLDIKSSAYPGKEFHCQYLSCSQYSASGERLAKFALKLSEPNPADRAVRTRNNQNP